MAAPFAIKHETTTSLHPRPRRARDRRPYFPGLQARREAPKVLPPPDVLVRKGDVLFEVDSRPFVAALSEAKGQLDQGKAMQLASQAEAERSQEPLPDQRSGIPRSGEPHPGEHRQAARSEAGVHRTDWLPTVEMTHVGPKAHARLRYKNAIFPQLKSNSSHSPRLRRLLDVNSLLKSPRNRTPCVVRLLSSRCFREAAGLATRHS